jgi:peptidoglycan biosynthesis protein MviN/MurJ (putative lipid II flippase)
LLYLPGLPAAALDQMILFAFYARQRTLTPNLVQGAAILIYLATALPLLFLTPLGVAALILANAAQWIGHALILYLLSRRLVDLGKTSHWRNPRKVPGRLSGALRDCPAAEQCSGVRRTAGCPGCRR